MSDDGRDEVGGAVESVLTELRRRIVAREYPEGGMLPSQRELATSFNVSRDTVQRALRELRDEGWIKSRQGSGSRVVIKEPQTASAADAAARIQRVGMSWFVERAFARTEVRLDAFCLTSESLDVHLRVQVERILAGLAPVPAEIRLRMLLPDREMDLPVPRNIDAPDDKSVVERLLAISDRCLSSLRDTLQNLRANSPVQEVDFQVRRVPVAPMFKLFLLNESEAFQTMYKLARRRIPLGGSEEVEAVDILSVGATGTYFDKGDDEDDAQAAWVKDQQEWFDSLWEHLAT
ncbi:winged helix-turn-helix domain-containing protein [Streptomyces hokutonensis]|uniref:winged helix-turn-helix domain-containing protein n=1 Tax=Streptomyces hokutonensis TaxID=1306990 RepID=UPI00037713B2|nr:winged helix-turn-helix domain-containing protein [Streptomyces hokutonensis]